MNEIWITKIKKEKILLAKQLLDFLILAVWRETKMRIKFTSLSMMDKQTKEQEKIHLTSHFGT